MRKETLLPQSPPIGYTLDTTYFYSKGNIFFLVYLTENTHSNQGLQSLIYQSGWAI